MVRLEMHDPGPLAVLTLPTRLTRGHADMLKTYLRRSLERRSRLIVDCGEVASVDEDCLAVLCAAFRLSKSFGGDFMLAGNRSAAFLEAARASRALHCVECGLDSEDGCIWGPE